jgi:ABC-2 type transport system permease protein
VGLVIGGLIWGFDPLVSLSGTHISVGRGPALIAAGGLAYFMPMIAVASIALLLSDALAQLRAGGGRDAHDLPDHAAARRDRRALVPAPVPALGAVNAWQGFLRTPIDWAPIGHAAYAIPALAVAFTAFVRRDVAGG